MNNTNFFFKLTGTDEKYTEQHLSDVIAEILSNDAALNFNSLYKKIVEIYPDVRLNRRAIFEFASSKFNVVDTWKKLISEDKNYFFGLQNRDEEYTEEYLIKKIEEILSEQPLDEVELYDRFVRLYGGAKIKIIAFENLLHERFICNEKRYHINPEFLHRHEETTKEIRNEDLTLRMEYLSELNKHAALSTEELYKVVISQPSRYRNLNKTAQN